MKSIEFPSSPSRYKTFPLGKYLSFMLSESRLEKSDKERESSGRFDPLSETVDGPVSFFKSLAVTNPFGNANIPGELIVREYAERCQNPATLEHTFLFFV